MPSSASLTRIGLIEGDPVQSAEMIRLLRTDSRLSVQGAWSSAGEAIAPLTRLIPDIVLVDLSLTGLPAAELVRGLAPLLPATQFMMLTAYEDPERLFETLAAGATGYLIKKTALTRLLDAVQELRAGGSPMSAAIARQVVQQLRPAVPHLGGTVAAPSTLNACEAEILHWLAAGQSHDEVSERLGGGVSTVRILIRGIYRKLQAHHRAEAARLPAVEA